LAILDQTYLNFSSHLAKTDLGRISEVSKKKHHQYGLIQHNLLCVSDKNEPLGLLDVQHFHYDDFDTKISSDKRSIETKKTHFWVDSVTKMQQMLGEDAAKVIVMADAESDFFEFSYALHEKKTNYIIRASHNRCLDKEIYHGDKLFDILEKAPDIGEMRIEINDVKTHEIKAITLKIKKLESISIPVPRWPKENSKNKDYKPIEANIVKVYNDEYCWILLTNLDVSSVENCQKIISLYKERWHIEDYHKVLKTGYQIDELFLHASREAIENALIVASISACRLYWLIFLGRTDENLKANYFFTELEWKSVYIYFKESLPEDVPLLKEVVLRVARLGGYKNQKKSNLPGIKVLWLGWQSFTVIAEMYKNVMSMKT
jgi:hypothetical protein